MSDSFNKTLLLITDEKIAKLRDQKVALDEYAVKLLASAESATDKLETIGILHDGLTHLPVTLTPDQDLMTGVLKFIETAPHDVSIREDTLDHWISVLKQELQYIRNKIDASFVFGNVLTQWLEQGCEQTMATPSQATNGELTKKETIEQLISLTLEAYETDNDALSKWFDATFEDIDLTEVRNAFEDFSMNITKSTVKAAIRTLSFKDLLDNDTIIQELTTLLNTRLKNIDSWSWPNDAVKMDLRRNISGRYRAYHDEDVVTAVFLECVGLAWAAKIKEVFTGIYTKHWKRSEAYNDSINHHRFTLFRQNLMTNLPNKIDDGKTQDYDNGPTQNKNTLIDMIRTEILLSQNEFFVLKTDIKWCGPSIPHRTLLEILEFLGVTSEWLNFFERFLQVPMVFEDSPPVVRRRGVPISHMLSTAFAEVMLFCMDLTVNKSSGLTPYRIHDDIWLFSPDKTAMEGAYFTIQNFMSLMGLKLNMDKTGSICVGKHVETSLPKGDVRWGLLKLETNGVFTVDLASCNDFIDEMREQLNRAKSVITWVTVFNRYMSFFIRNLGQPSVAAGNQHVKQVIKAIMEIQKRVFNGNPVECLEKKFPDVFKGIHVLDQMAYWSLEEGGLGLKHPLIKFVDMDELRDAHKIIKDAQDFDAKVYEAFKNHGFGGIMWVDEKHADFSVAPSPLYTSAMIGNTLVKYLQKPLSRIPHVFKKVHSLKDMCLLHETYLPYWGLVYANLMSSASEHSDDYSTTLSEYYGDQFLSKFNSDTFIDTNLIPLSMVERVKSAGLKWE